MRRYFYFDMDGVMVDSCQAVRAAYERALNRRLDDVYWAKVWGKPWREWLPDLTGEVGEAVTAHRRKNAFYLELVAASKVPSLAGAEAVRRLWTADHAVRIITGASETAAHAVLSHLQLPVTLLEITEASPQDKIVRLGNVNSRGGALMVDDDENVIAKLEARGVPAIHFNGQSIDELMDELWTRSS